MSREACRVAVVAAIEAAKATWSAYTLVIEYDNRNVDIDALGGNPYLCVKLDFVTGYQVDYNKSPTYRGLGNIKLSAVVKEGAGSAKANELLEYFYTRLHMRNNMPPVRTFAVQHLRTEPPEKGEQAYSVNLPFFFDTIHTV